MMTPTTNGSFNTLPGITTSISTTSKQETMEQTKTTPEENVFTELPEVENPDALPTTPDGKIGDRKRIRPYFTTLPAIDTTDQDQDEFIVIEDNDATLSCCALTEESSGAVLLNLKMFKGTKYKTQSRIFALISN